MREITHCRNNGCPFKDCERHMSNAGSGGYYSLADFSGTCRRYITWLVKELKNEHNNSKKRNV